MSLQMTAERQNHLTTPLLFYNAAVLIIDLQCSLDRQMIVTDSFSTTSWSMNLSGQQFIAKESVSYVLLW